jgi:predicted GNAT family acetyltransferase
VNIDVAQLHVRNNEIEHRFEIEAAGELAMLEYRRAGDRIIYIHTAVPPALEGHGIAGRLAQHALDHAREQGLSVVPRCPYVRAYIAQHPEYEDLVTDI